MHRLKILSVVAVALAVTAAPAQAKKNPYTPQQVCGTDDFAVIDSHVVRTPSVRLGRTYLLYNPNTGFNCVVTLKSYAVGVPSHVSATIQKQGGRQRTDEGEFRYYAGPRKVHAPGTCVQWGGSIRHGSLSSGLLTGFEHCG